MTDDRLLQEILLERDPTGWRMLVGCMLLNQTTRKQVDQVWPTLFGKYPDAQSMKEARFEDVKAIVGRLGLGTRRARAIKTFSNQWVTMRQGTSVSSRHVRGVIVKSHGFHGLGEYAADSWRIFVDGRVTWRPRDKELQAWLERQTPEWEEMGVAS